MSDPNGWIKLHRKITENWIWEEPENLRAWIDILLMVNHKVGQCHFCGHIMEVKPGQRVTSIHKLAERWNWTRPRVRRFLELLEEADMISVNRTTSGVLISVVNWAIYQSDRPTGNTTSDTTSDTTSNTTTDTTGDTQTRMNKNDKNGKKEEEAPPRPLSAKPWWEIQEGDQ